MLFDSNLDRIPDLRGQHSLLCQSPRQVQTECKSWMNLIRIHQIVINYLIIVRRPASVWSLAWIHVKVPPQYLNFSFNAYFDFECLSSDLSIVARLAKAGVLQADTPLRCWPSLLPRGIVTKSSLQLAWPVRELKLLKGLETLNEWGSSLWVQAILQ